jgi:hypothetical protein
MQHAIKKTTAVLLSLLLSLFALGTAHAQVSERVKVADPYLEMRTGPGRGYPVTHVAERHEFVIIELRNTDWFKVRTVSDTGNDKTGWVHRRQLATTLTDAGVAKSFRDIALDDYLSRRVQIGAAYGRFGGEPMQKLWGSYRFSDALSFEGTIAQVQGVFSGTDMWYGNLLAEPWSDQRLSPFPEPVARRRHRHRCESGQRHRRRSLLSDRALRAARRLHALHRLRLRPTLAGVPRRHRRPFVLLLLTSKERHTT